MKKFLPIIAITAVFLFSGALYAQEANPDLQTGKQESCISNGVFLDLVLENIFPQQYSQNADYQAKAQYLEKQGVGEFINLQASEALTADNFVKVICSLVAPATQDQSCNLKLQNLLKDDKGVSSQGSCLSETIVLDALKGKLMALLAEEYQDPEINTADFNVGTGTEQAVDESKQTASEGEPEAIEGEEEASGNDQPGKKPKYQDHPGQQPEPPDYFRNYQTVEIEALNVTLKEAQEALDLVKEATQERIQNVREVQENVIEKKEIKPNLGVKK